MSLGEQSAEKHEYEIILINNNSTDNTERICLDFKAKNTSIDFNYFVEYNQGLSFARNRGIKESKYPILAFIDDDAIASYNYVKEIINFFEHYKDIDVLGGKISPIYETEKPKWMSTFLESLTSVIDLGEKTCQLK
jgi:glycosyltransferase involved in cell wall biosynthesis